MGGNRVKTKVQGVRYREHATRKHGMVPDRYFFIRYRVDGKEQEEGLGWASEGWTVSKAADTLAELKRNQRTGEGEKTLQEKRDAAEAERQAELDRQRAEQEAAELEKKRNITFQAFFENTYLPIQKTYKPFATWSKEMGRATNWLYPVVADVPLVTISPFHIERIKKRILDEKRAPRTLQHVLATFRQVWNAARRAGVVSGDSPTRSVKIPRFDNQRQRFLTDSECDALLNELKRTSIEAYQFSVLSLDAGLRFGEAAKLSWGDIDTVRETILLRDTKSGHNRTVYMTERIKSMFNGMERGMPDNLIFPGPNGKPKTEIGDVFGRAVARLGLNDGVSDSRMKVVFHSLRHTHASRLLEAGTDIYLVKTLLGHRNITTTERYLHVRADGLRSAIRNMEKMKSGGNVIPINRAG
jgi:integrase